MKITSSFKRITKAASQNQRSTLTCVALLLLLAIYSSSGRSESERTVVIRLSGRLGNQLFQLAAGYYINEQPNLNVKYVENLYSTETDYRSTLFSGIGTYPSVESACGDTSPTKTLKIEWDCSDLDEAIAEATRSRCTVIDSLFQCHEIAEKGRTFVASRLKAQIKQYIEASRIVQSLRFKKELVAMHVRRGDYTKKFNRNLLEPLPPFYYHSAMRLMPKNATFAVFSDDLKWCEEAFYEERMGGRLDFVKIDHPLVALMVMAGADHHIVANSTFSWWSAFLRSFFSRAQAGKHLVIAPKTWYGSRKKEDVDLVPHEWTLLNHLED